MPNRVAVQGLGLGAEGGAGAISYVSNGLIYLKMEEEIGHTLLTPLGTHFSWLLWGRSRSASFLRGH